MNFSHFMSQKNPKMNRHTFPLCKNQLTIASRDPTGLGVGEKKKMFISFTFSRWNIHTFWTNAKQEER